MARQPQIAELQNLRNAGFEKSKIREKQNSNFAIWGRHPQVDDGGVGQLTILHQQQTSIQSEFRKILNLFQATLAHGLAV